MQRPVSSFARIEGVEAMGLRRTRYIPTVWRRAVLAKRGFEEMNVGKATIVHTLNGLQTDQ
jgi:hypothetical protein